MFCEKCGTKIQDGQVFCENCGAKIENTEVVENNNFADEQTAYEQAPADYTAPAENVIEPVAEEPVAADPSPAFCSNCGSVLEPGTVFCSVCGTRNDDAPTEFTAPVTPAATKLPFAKVIIAAVVALIAIFVVAKAYPYASNAITKMVMSPEKYFSHVVKNNFKDSINDISDLYALSKDSLDKGASSKGTVELSVDSELYGDIDDISGEDISEYLDWLEKASIDVSAASKDNKYNANLDVKLNGKKIASYDAIMDYASGEGYMGVPELSSTYFYTEIPNTEEMSEILETVSNVLPSAKVTKKILNRYIAAALKGIDEVEEDKDTIEAEGISQKVTVLSVEFSEETAVNISRSVLETAIEDKDLEDIFENLSELDDAPDYDEFVDMMESALDSIENVDPSTDTVATLELYVDGKGEIVGFALDANGAEFKMYSAKKGSKIGFIAEGGNGLASVSLEGSGKMAGDKVSGEFVLKALGNDIVEFDVKKFDTKKFAKGIFNGSVTITPSEDAIDMLSYSAGREIADFLEGVSLTYVSKSNSIKDSKVELILNKDDKEYVKLSVSAKVGGAKKVSIPSDETDDMEDWIDSLDLSKLIENLEKAGVPDYLISQLEDSLDY